MSDELTNSENDFEAWLSGIRQSWRSNTSMKEIHLLRCAFQAGEVSRSLRLAARQPSPSARDVALKCAEICEELFWRQGKSLSAVVGEIHAYADTLANESSPNLDPTAGLGSSDLTEEKSND